MKSQKSCGAFRRGRLGPECILVAAFMVRVVEPDAWAWAVATLCGAERGLNVSLVPGFLLEAVMRSWTLALATLVMEVLHVDVAWFLGGLGGASGMCFNSRVWLLRGGYEASWGQTIATCRRSRWSFAGGALEDFKFGFFVGFILLGVLVDFKYGFFVDFFLQGALVDFKYGFFMDAGVLRGSM